MKILAICLALPPLKVQMSYVCAKQLIAFVNCGVEMDVIAVDYDQDFLQQFGTDYEFSKYLDGKLNKITYLRDHAESLAIRSLRRLGIGDLMSRMTSLLTKHLMEIDLNQYDVLISFSPFHSVNHAIAQAKKVKNFFWVAHFCDPWSGNPLEVNKIRQCWNYLSEKKCLVNADLIVHSSVNTMELMRKNLGDKCANMSFVPHIYDPNLYPQKEKIKGEKMIIRHVGSLYEKRSPESFLVALSNLIERRKDLSSKIVVELVGTIEQSLVCAGYFQTLPDGLVRIVPPVSYIKSLELMQDSDLLLLIESGDLHDLFFPSKLADYFGAETMLFCIAPTGFIADICTDAGFSYCLPSDLRGIEMALERQVDAFFEEKTTKLNQLKIKKYNSLVATEEYIQLIRDVSHA